MSVFVLPVLEQAAATFLRAQTFSVADEDGIVLDSTRIFQGFQRAATVEEEKKMLLPCVIVSSTNAVNEVMFSGNWVGDLLIEVKSKVFDTSDTKHQQMAEEVFAFFADSDIAQDLSDTVADFKAFMILPRQQSRSVENNVWVSRFRFQAICCGADIA